MRIQTSVLALLVLAGAAYAQPATFTDLGSRVTSQAFTQAVTLLGPTDIQWFRIELPPVQASAGYVDIWTTPTANPVPATDLTDTEIGLYANSGAGASTGWNDDDDGPGLYSALSYGSTVSRGTTTFGALTAGVARNGRDGALAGGVYWLAVGKFNVTFATNFVVTSTATGTQTNTVLNFDILVPTDPYPPTVTAALSPTSVSANSPVLLTATVVPGGNPTSTVLVATADFSSVGGSATQAMYDDGTHGDVTAGDNVFSYSYTIPVGTPQGSFTVPVHVADAQARTANTSATANVFAPQDVGTIGSTPVSATLAFAAPGDIKWLKFRTLADCDPTTNYLDIDTEGSTLTGTGTNPNDTEIGLYTVAGTLISSDDDSGSGALSQLTFGATGSPRPAVGDGLAYTGTDGTNGTLVVAGDYYLAVGIYNVNFAANLAVTHTDSAITTGSNGNIVVNFNSNLPGGGPTCGAADVGGVGGVQGADNHLDNNDFVVFIDLFFGNSPLADQGSTGGVAGPDGVWDNNDFVVFIDNFFQAPASCR